MDRADRRVNCCLEVKKYPDGRQITFACDLLAMEPARQLLGYTLSHSTSVAGLFLPAGTRSYGCFWANQPYNLYLWMQSCGLRRSAMIGAYFNVCDAVELGREELRWRDLWVDVLVLPARPPVILDRDEIPIDQSSKLITYIEHAVDVLQARSGDLIEECLRWVRVVQDEA